MRLVCPACGAACAAEAWSNDSEARQVIRTVADMPESVSRRALAYLALFRPMTGRGLRWPVVLRHLAELDRLVRDPSVQWEQRPARPNDSRFWSQGMDKLIEHPPRQLPLKSHGYLRAMVYEIADDADREGEKARNARLAAHRGGVDIQQAAERINAEDMRRISERKGL